MAPRTHTHTFRRVYFWTILNGSAFWGGCTTPLNATRLVHNFAISYRHTRNMEDLLQQIIKEATGNKFAHLRNGAQNAHGKPGDHQSKIMPHDSTLYLIQYCMCVRRQTAAPARLPSGSVVRAAHRVPDRHADGAGDAAAEVRYAGAEWHARELLTRLYVCVVSSGNCAVSGTREVVLLKCGIGDRRRRAIV